MKPYKVVLFCLIFLLAGCGSSPSPVLPPVKLSAVTNAFVIKRQWQSDFGDGAGDNYLRLTPVLDKGVLYAVDFHGILTAYDIAKADTLWQVNLNIPVGSALSLDQNLILLGSSNGDVLAVNKNDGKTVWHAQVSSEVLAPPAISGDTIVVRCVNGMLYALDRKDGKQLWSLEQTTPALTLRGTSKPVISGDIVLAAFDNGRLLALNLQNGKILWQAVVSVPRGRTDLERMVDIDANPVVVDDTVYVVSYQGRLAAIQLGSGRILWTRDIPSYIGMSVDAYRIYLVDSDSRVWALDRMNGATLWKQEALLRRSLTPPRLQDNYVIEADFDGFIHWLRRDNGKLVARLRLNTFDYTHPDLDETEDLNFPKHNNILIPPLVDDHTLIAMDRYGHTEGYQIDYP